MPSAGRPFTTELVTELVSRGILVAPVTLHTGVSSPERGEPPYPERYRVPERPPTRQCGARLGRSRDRSRHHGRPRARDDGGRGWNGLRRRGLDEPRRTPERGLHAVDGLVTGWHDHDSSHLQMLEAAAGADLLERSYSTARARGYLWHEFGDVHLILP